MYSHQRLLLPLIILLTMSGCVSIGPKTVVRDRFHYTESIAESWKNEMLLNLVKLRYGDFPVFLDISGVVNQYSVEGQISLGASGGASAVNQAQSIGASGKYADKPTITYTPIIGERFISSILKPIPPESILSMVQAGWPIEFVMGLCVQSINGLDNRFGGALGTHQAEPEFHELMTAMRVVQQAGEIGLRVEDTEDKRDSVLIVVRKGEKLSDESSTVRRLLGLSEEMDAFKVVYGTLPRSKDEIAINSRSMLSIMADLAAEVMVPKDHVKKGKVLPTFIDKATEAGGNIVSPKVHTSLERPDEAFAQASYRGNWFYIDDNDIRSKRTFSFVMLLFSLAETGSGSTSGPILTLPAN